MVTKVRTTLHSGQQWTRAFIRVKVKVVPRNYKKKEKQNGFCIYQKCGKFRSVLLAHFIKYKLLISKEWVQEFKCQVTLEKDVLYWLTWLGQGLKKILQSLVCLSSLSSWAEVEGDDNIIVAEFIDALIFPMTPSWSPENPRFFKNQKCSCVVYQKSIIDSTYLFGTKFRYRYIIILWWWFKKSWLSPLADCFERFLFWLSELKSKEILLLDIISNTKLLYE